MVVTREAKCPNCGKTGKCEYKGDSGGASCFCDDYEFKCPHCGYVASKSIYAGGYDDGWLTNCPYCGTNCVTHNKEEQRK